MSLPNTDAGRLGSEQAQRIAQECYADVLAYCRRHAPAGYEAVDLAQETFLRFVRAGSYTERGKPIAYLMRVARSVCIDASRTRRVPVVELDFDVAEEGSDFAAGAGGLDGALDSALAKLPSDLQEAVELRFGADLGVAEVAQVLGISRFAARRRINAALAQLEAELEAEQEAQHEEERCEEQKSKKWVV